MAASARTAAAPTSPGQDPPRRYVRPAKLALDLSRIFDVPITERTLAHWRRAGTGPSYVRVGRYIRYDVRAVEGWVEQHRRCGLAPGQETRP